MSPKVSRRLLVLVSDMKAGGAERVAATLAGGWTARGDSVCLIATYSQAVECQVPLPGAVKFIRLADAPGCKGRDPVAYLHRFNRLRALIRSLNPGVIVSFLTNVNVFAVIAAAGSAVPVVVSERVDPASESETSIGLRVLRWITYPFADAIAVQTNRAAIGLAARIARTSVIGVIPNPIPPEIVAAGRMPTDPGQRRLIIAAGRLTAQKRFDVLIDAFALIAERFPQWDVRIWGEGELKSDLKDQIERLGLGSRITLPGRTDLIWREMEKADAFALSSDFEGFPNVLLEALALGVACVATDCVSGPRELTRDGALALLVPSGSPDAFASALERLMSDAGLRDRLGRTAADSVRRDYALPSILALWDKLFARIC